MIINSIVHFLIKEDGGTTLTIAAQTPTQTARMRKLNMDCFGNISGGMVFKRDIRKRFKWQ